MNLSNSRITMVQKCGYQYYLAYVLNLKRPPGIAMVIGTGTHRGAEFDLRFKLETGDLLPLDEVQDIARDGVRYAWGKNGVLLLPEEKTVGLKKLKGDAIDMTVKLSKLHHEAAAPLIEPVSIERRWALDIGDTGHTLTGRIDCETKRGIRDLKTRARKPVKGAIDVDQQLTTYALAYYTLNGVMPSEIAFDNLIKKVEPEYVPETTTRTKDDFVKLLARIEAAIKVIETGAYMPTNPDNWWCSPKYCGYYNECPYV